MAPCCTTFQTVGWCNSESSRELIMPHNKTPSRLHASNRNPSAVGQPDGSVNDDRGTPRGDRGSGTQHGELIQKPRVLAMHLIVEKITPAHRHMGVLSQEKRFQSRLLDSRRQLGDPDTAVSQ